MRVIQGLGSGSRGFAKFSVSFRGPYNEDYSILGQLHKLLTSPVGLPLSSDERSHKKSYHSFNLLLCHCCSFV